MRIVRKTRLPGLPEALPPGEECLWQGSPHWWSLARHAFRIRGIALYFGALAVLRAALALSEGGSMLDALLGALWLGFIGAVAIALFCLYAKLVARSTIYTITTRRLVMHFGVALPMTINLPFKAIAAAAMRENMDGTGDIPVSLSGAQRVSWLVMWPHARPWRFSQVEPMLRGVPEVRRVAAILSDAVIAFKAQEQPEAVIETRRAGSQKPQSAEAAGGLASAAA